MLVTPPPNSDQPLTDQRPQAPLGLAVVAFALLNLLGMPLGAAIADSGPGEGVIWLIAIGMGGIIAQFGVLPAWLVWGDRPFWKRLLRHWGLVTLLYVCWVLGMLMAFGSQGGPPPSEFLRVAGTVYLLIPAISLGIESPLWLTRLVFGWRFRRAGEADDERPLAIRDFLMGMAVISVALALVRGATATAMGPQSTEIWLIITTSGISGAVASALVLLPVAFWILRLKDAAQGLGIVAAYAGVASLVVGAIMASFMGANPDGSALIAVFLLVGSTIAAVTGAMALARQAGYRLAIGKRRAE